MHVHGMYYTHRWDQIDRSTILYFRKGTALSRTPNGQETFGVPEMQARFGEFN